MFGRLLSPWDGLFSGATLVSGSVSKFQLERIEVKHSQKIKLWPMLLDWNSLKFKGRSYLPLISRILFVKDFFFLIHDGKYPSHYIV